MWLSMLDVDSRPHLKGEDQRGARTRKQGPTRRSAGEGVDESWSRVRAGGRDGGEG